MGTGTDENMEGGSISPLQQMAASCSGAILTSLMVTPFDVVKIRLQKQVKQKYSGSTFSHGVRNHSLVKKENFLSHRTFCKNFFCSTTAENVVTPWDVVKVRLQAQRLPMKAGNCFIYCNGLMDHLCTCGPTLNGQGRSAANSALWYARPGRFNGTFDAMIKIAKVEGISSLWSGLPPTLVMAVPATVCYFTLYDTILERLRKRFGKQFWIPMVAGGSARIAAVSLISPLEMIRTKMQSERLSYLEIFKAIKVTTNNKGFLSLWTGWGPTILRDVPFSVTYWFFYETFKNTYISRFNPVYPSFLVTFCFGAVAGMCAAVLTCPFDVIKTHRQIELGELEAIKDFRTKPTSTWILLGKLYRQQGFRALFAGLTPRLIKVTPACAIMIGTYEYLKAFFKERNKQSKTSS